MKSTADWTWLVFMAGDNNLEGAGRDDLAEMQKAGSTAAVQVLVQFDTRRDQTSRYRIGPGQLESLQTLPGVNCGQPRVLTEFMEWGRVQAPARHYVVDIWNHGGGWENLPPDYDYEAIRSTFPRRAHRLRQFRRALFRSTLENIHSRSPSARAIAIDCGAQDYLDNRELREALGAAWPVDRKLEILGCDACLMAMLEIAYELKDTAHVLVASEETEPGDGWPYTEILGDLNQRPALTPAQLAKAMVKHYADSYPITGQSWNDGVTLSALNLDRLEPVAEAVQELSEILLADLPTLGGPACLARDRAQAFAMQEYIDLGDFARQLAQTLSQHGRIRETTTRVLTALDPPSGEGLVLAHAASGQPVHRATGVSLYFPKKSGYSPDYADLRFSQDFGWCDFLEALFH